MGLPIDEIVQRRPYNAAADLIDANLARGLADKTAFTDPRAADVWRTAGAQLPLRPRAEGAGAARRKPADAAAPRHR